MVLSQNPSAPGIIQYRASSRGPVSLRSEFASVRTEELRERIMSPRYFCRRPDPRVFIFANFRSREKEKGKKEGREERKKEGKKEGKSDLLFAANFSIHGKFLDLRRKFLKWKLAALNREKYVSDRRKITFLVRNDRIRCSE